MERHSSNAMFISEIPVRCINNNEKLIKWIGNLTDRTTVRDIILSVFPGCNPVKYSLYVHTDRKKQILNETSLIYKIVEKINKKHSSRSLLFEIRSKKIVKRVRFADEIIVQNIIQGQCISNEKVTSDMIETISIPFEKRLENLKENFQKNIYQKQENYRKLSSYSKRSSLSILNENIPRSSSESGISSNLSTEDLILPNKLILETLV